MPVWHERSSSILETVNGLGTVFRQKSWMPTVDHSLLQTTSVTRSVFHRHGPSDRLLMELLLFNVHVRDWVTVPSPSLTKEFGTIGQLHYGKQSLLLVSKDSWILIFTVVRLTANFSLLLFYFLVFYCCNAQQVYAKQIPRLIWFDIIYTNKLSRRPRPVVKQ